MTAADRTSMPRRLRGGPWGPILVTVFVVCAATLPYALDVLAWSGRTYGHEIPFASAMFGPPIEQPIAFSHRLHVTDKEIDCFFCHPHGERSPSAGIPPVETCLGCHAHVIPRHEEIRKLRGYSDVGEGVPWVRVYYNPDHVFFPHNRHLARGVECRECHGEIETVDRLHEVTFTMGLCLDCHRERDASTDCVACHQ